MGIRDLGREQSGVETEGNEANEEQRRGGVGRLVRGVMWTGLAVAIMGAMVGCALLAGRGPGARVATVVLKADGFPSWMGSTGVAIVKLNGVPLPQIVPDETFSVSRGRHEALVRHYTRFGAFRYTACRFRVRRARTQVLLLRYEEGRVRATLSRKAVAE